MPVPAPLEFRRRVITYLALLSSDRSREVLSEWIEPQELAFQLCRVWFDEIYVPSSTYFDGLKGDYSGAAASAFRAAFDDAELAALERFHRFFELRVEMLRKQAREAGRFPDTDGWRHLMKDASYLLEDLEPGSIELRKRLEDGISNASRQSDLSSLLKGASGVPPVG